ncbi:MAG: hypothetical protein Q4E64_10060, partial [Phascolarctobacterium sp.]|uniref:type IIL restriction-modification enzyme MmeI n=1 Tax=Phascolarctobacterium sp. TaxID=2049039 RepID=UPI0026DC5736
IVGFSCAANNAAKYLYDDKPMKVENINPYLVDGPNVFIESRKKSISNIPEMVKGSSPVDGGNLLISDESYFEFQQKEPDALRFIRPFLGAREYIHNIKRWCLWLDGESPALFRNLPMVKLRIEATRNFRLDSTKEATRKYADYPFRFMEMRQPETDYILIPRHSSENRKYIPFGFMKPEMICGDANSMIPNANLYHFGVLISNVHMAWMRAVCGRIKSDYRYSNDIVYNNFPWPTPTAAQREKIERTAQGILDARALYPDSSLADLYDELTMPKELRDAHRANDRAVMEAYGFWGKLNSEAACVAELMKMYRTLAGES